MIASYFRLCPYCNARATLVRRKYDKNVVGKVVAPKERTKMHLALHDGLCIAQLTGCKIKWFGKGSENL